MKQSSANMRKVTEGAPLKIVIPRISLRFLAHRISEVTLFADNEDIRGDKNPLLQSMNMDH